MSEAKIIKKVSYSDTIKALPIGGEIKFKTADVRSTSIRRIVYNLNAKGFRYEATEAGLVNEIKVTRSN